MQRVESNPFFCPTQDVNSIGHILMNGVFDAACVKGIKVMAGEALAANQSMLELVCRLGFEVTVSKRDAAVKRIVKQL